MQFRNGTCVMILLVNFSYGVQEKRSRISGDVTVQPSRKKKRWFLCNAKKKLCLRSNENALYGQDFVMSAACDGRPLRNVFPCLEIKYCFFEKMLTRYHHCLQDVRKGDCVSHFWLFLIKQEIKPTFLGRTKVRNLRKQLKRWHDFWRLYDLGSGKN